MDCAGGVWGGGRERRARTGKVLLSPPPPTLSICFVPKKGFTREAFFPQNVKLFFWFPLDTATTSSLAALFHHGVFRVTNDKVCHRGVSLDDFRAEPRRPNPLPVRSFCQSETPTENVNFKIRCCPMGNAVLKVDSLWWGVDLRKKSRLAVQSSSSSCL